MILLDPRVAIVFSLPCDKDIPENERVKFHIGPITIGDENIIRDKSFVRDGENYRFSFAQKRYWALQLGLKKIDNLKDVQGNAVDLPRAPGNETGGALIPDSFLERIPEEYRNYIADRIIATFEIDLETAKN